jgi:hypothetical protein
MMEGGQFIKEYPVQYNYHFWGKNYLQYWRLRHEGGKPQKVLRDHPDTAREWRSLLVLAETMYQCFYRQELKIRIQQRLRVGKVSFYGPPTKLDHILNRLVLDRLRTEKWWYSLIVVALITALLGLLIYLMIDSPNGNKAFYFMTTAYSIALGATSALIIGRTLASRTALVIGILALLLPLALPLVTYIH